ncbi:hypothetical protein PENSPDRAFT_672159 [Peniophora sp. CONT]|nr:hypothetical protein PENSPDRAFT_672159 [Peniophora sp. CONT]
MSTDWRELYRDVSRIVESPPTETSQPPTSPPSNPHPQNTSPPTPASPPILPTSASTATARKGKGKKKSEASPEVPLLPEIPEAEPAPSPDCPPRSTPEPPPRATPESPAPQASARAPLGSPASQLFPPSRTVSRAQSPISVTSSPLQPSAGSSMHRIGGRGQIRTTAVDLTLESDDEDANIERILGRKYDYPLPDDMESIPRQSRATRGVSHAGDAAFWSVYGDGPVSYQQWVRRVAREDARVPDLPKHLQNVGYEMAWAHSAIYSRHIHDAKRAVSAQALASTTERNLRSIRSLEERVRELRDLLTPGDHRAPQPVGSLRSLGGKSSLPGAFGGLVGGMTPSGSGHVAKPSLSTGQASAVVPSPAHQHTSYGAVGETRSVRRAEPGVVGGAGASTTTPARSGAGGASGVDTSTPGALGHGGRSGVVAATPETIRGGGASGVGASAPGPSKAGGPPGAALSTPEKIRGGGGSGASASAPGPSRTGGRPGAAQSTPGGPQFGGGSGVNAATPGASRIGSGSGARAPAVSVSAGPLGASANVPTSAGSTAGASRANGPVRLQRMSQINSTSREGRKRDRASGAVGGPVIKKPRFNKPS